MKKKYEVLICDYCDISPPLSTDTKTTQIWIIFVLIFKGCSLEADISYFLL